MAAAGGSGGAAAATGERAQAAVAQPALQANPALKDSEVLLVTSE